MGSVKVRFFATFREVAGCQEAQVDAKDVEDLLEVLRGRYGPRFSSLVRGGAEDAFVILVNGRNTGQMQGLSTRLSDGDEVSLFPPVSGG